MDGMFNGKLYFTFSFSAKKAPIINILMIFQRKISFPFVNIMKKKSVGSVFSSLSETSHVTLSCSLTNMWKSNVGVYKLFHVRIWLMSSSFHKFHSNASSIFICHKKYTRINKFCFFEKMPCGYSKAESLSCSFQIWCVSFHETKAVVSKTWRQAVFGAFCFKQNA